MNITLLIVDDVEINRTVLSESLWREGLDCYLAENGQEALDIVRDHPIDLVLMDKQMPIMNGFDATRLIRLIKPDLPIIGISADISEHDQQLAVECGMNELLLKPINLRHLIKRVSQLLGVEDSALSTQSASYPESDGSGNGVLNKAKALSYFGGKLDLYHHALEQFRHCRDLQDLIVQFTELNATKDDLSFSSEVLFQRWLRLSKLVHRLRGVTAMIGAQNLNLLLERLHQHVCDYELPQDNYLAHWHDNLVQTQSAIELQLGC